MQYDRLPSPKSPPQSPPSLQDSHTPPPPGVPLDAATTRPSRTASIFQDVYERLNSLETGLDRVQGEVQNQMQTVTMRMDALQEFSTAKSAHVLDMQARLERVEHMLGRELGWACQSPPRSPVPAFEGAVNANGP